MAAPANSDVPAEFDRSVSSYGESLDFVAVSVGVMASSVDEFGAANLRGNLAYSAGPLRVGGHGYDALEVASGEWVSALGVAPVVCRLSHPRSGGTDLVHPTHGEDADSLSCVRSGVGSAWASLMVWVYYYHDPLCNFNKTEPAECNCSTIAIMIHSVWISVGTVLSSAVVEPVASVCSCCEGRSR